MVQMSCAEIRKVCNEVFARVGQDFDFFGIEIKINARLKTTLGRCRSLGGTVLSIEISKQLLETATMEDIIATIEHECAHALCVIEYGESQKHNALFKQMCARIGCTNDGTKRMVTRVVAAEEVFKYTIYCPTCGNIGGVSRMCKTLRNISTCYCKKCKGTGLTYKQNW